MKVCIVSLNIVPFFSDAPDRSFGGAETQAAFVAGALRACGHDVTLVVSDLRDPGHIPFPVENAFESGDGVPGLRFFHPRWTGIMDALARADCDVYYQRNVGMITGLTAIFCRRKNRAFVYGAGSDIDFDVPQRLLNGLRDRALFGYGLKTSDGFVVQNQYQMNEARKRFDKPMRLIPNGVIPLREAPPVVPNRVVWIGALRGLKRPELVVEMARRLPHIQFSVLGGSLQSEPQTARDIEAAATPLENIELRGRVPHVEVSQALADASLLLNTSSSEGFPNAYLEAWSHGRPVVTFNDVDGLIAKSGAGAVCGNLEEMVEAVRAIAGDSGTLRDMGERARAMITDNFSPEAIGPRYAGFFEELFDKRGRVQPGHPA